MASLSFISTCCHTNNTAGYPNDFSPTDLLLEDRVVSVLSLIFSVGSCLGIIIVLYPWHLTPAESIKDTLLRGVRQNTQGLGLSHVVKCLILSGVLANVGLIVRSCVWLFGLYPSSGDSDYEDSGHILCVICTVWVQYFFLCVVFWHLVYGLEAFMICHGKNSSKLLQHCLGWLVPALLCTVGVWVAYQPNLQHCAVQQSATRGTMYLVMLLPVVVVLVLILCLFYKSTAAVKRSIIHQRGIFSTAEREVVDQIQVKFILVTIAFTVCWFPNLLNGVLVNVLDKRGEDLILAVLALQAVLNPFEVLIDVMVLYGWPRGIWCAVLRAKCQGYQPIASSNINNLDVSRSSWFGKRDRSDGLLSFSRNQAL